MMKCFSNVLAAAIQRLDSTLAVQAPFLSHALRAWMCGISPTGAPAGHFEHPRMFPILELPEWIAASLGVPYAPEFHAAITYSSVCGYYYTRLIDNFMDDDCALARRQENLNLLPVVGFLAGEFQFEYHNYFPINHEFWKYFRSIWSWTAESTAHDAALRDINAEMFERISSRKFSAAGIPVAATCLFYGHANAIPRWTEFVQSLGRWSQMFDDILDWHDDRDHGRATWFLSEAHRRKCNGESVEQWIIREGNAWGFGLLNEWMADLLKQAADLGSASASEFLQTRQALARCKERDLTEGYGSLMELARILQFT